MISFVIQGETLTIDDYGELDTDGPFCLADMDHQNAVKLIVAICRVVDIHPEAVEDFLNDLVFVEHPDPKCG